MAIELVTFATLKSHLDLKQSLIADYPALGVIRDSVYQAIERYLKRTLEEATGAETYNVGSSPRKLIPLSRLPVSSVASVTVDGDVVTDYYSMPGGIRLYDAVADVVVVVTYTGGYADASTVPGGILRAALLQTVHEYQRRTNIGATSTTTQGGTVINPELALLKAVREELNPYRHPLKLM